MQAKFFGPRQIVETILLNQLGDDIKTVLDAKSWRQILVELHIGASFSELSVWLEFCLMLYLTALPTLRLSKNSV